MSKVANLFALLGDEEEDDMTVLVEHLSKKVEVAANKAAVVVESKKQPTQNQSQQVSSENGRGRQGRDYGSRNDKFSNEQSKRRNHYEGSNGNGYGQGRGGSRVRGRGRGSSNKNGSVDEKKPNEDESDGWKQVGRPQVRGYVEYSNRNGNKNYGGERNGHYRGSRDANGEQLENIEVKEDVETNEVKENVDNVDVNAVNTESSNAVSEGDAAAPVTEEPKEISAEEKRPEESVKAGKPAKTIEKEDENLMTLEEYEKVLAEKRKALESLKNEERKVAADKDFEAMQQLAKKKEDALLKPETSKLKKKDSIEKDDKSCKTVSINEFLKPADGETFVYRRPGRGRGRGGANGDFRRGDRSSRQGENRNKDNVQQSELGNKEKVEQVGFRGKFHPKEGRKVKDSPIVQIEDKGQFPVLLKGTAPAV